LWLLARLSPEESVRAAAQLGFHEKPRETHENQGAEDDGADRAKGTRDRVDRPPAPPVPTDLAPMSFWRLEEMRFDDSRRQRARIPKSGLTPEDIDSPGRTLFHTPPVQPLVPWSRLWPRLRAALQASVPGREPDVPALVRAWCRGDEVRRVPRLPRRVWAPRASVWIDCSGRLDPLWADQRDVWRRLRRACGPGLAARMVDGSAPAGTMSGEAVPRTDGLPPLLEGVRPDPETPVLVLGDLGAHGSDAERTVWLRTARWLRQAGARVSALVPSVRAFPDDELARAWRAVPWARGPSVTEDGGVDRLLRRLSLAAFVQPGLLRELRMLLPASEADASTEIEVWQHRDVRAADASGLVLHADAAARLRRELTERELRDKGDDGRSALLAPVRDAIRRWHEGLPTELLRVETLLWKGLGLASPPGDVGDALGFARRARATALRSRVDPDAAAALRALGSKALPLLPDEVYREVPGLDLVWAETFADVPDVRVPEGLDAVALRAQLGRSGKPRWWAVRQEGRRLVLRSVRGPRWASEARGAGSPVAWLLAAAPEVMVRRAGALREEKIRLEDGIALGEQEGDALVLRTDRSTVTLASWPREPWAVAVGRDRFGLWANAEVNGVVQRFRWIPPGRFKMGSPASEAGSYEDEGPQRQVTWTRGRWLADTPVTQALWEAVMGKGENPSRFKSPDRPVELVGWGDCKGFIRRLNAIVPGLDARLPSEAEWEHACRAGTETATWRGDLQIRGDHDAPVLDEIAWYGGNCGVGFELENGDDISDWPEKQYAADKGGTHPVRRKAPNPLGMYDMLGNVYEWCLDASAFPVKGYRDGDVTDPAAAPNDVGSGRVMRGGSWRSFARGVRAADRYAYDPASRFGSLGFRLARGQEPGPELEAEPRLRSGPRPARDALASEFVEDRFGIFMSFPVGDVVQRLRWIPDGTFTMGSPETEEGRWEDEGPQHEVTISEGYWLGETPVTQALWEAVMGSNPSQFRGPDRPVEQVSWEDCQQFLERLNAMVPGLEGRLPTEAEWERACRAGTAGPTWAGKNTAQVLRKLAWYGDNSGHQSHPVGKKPPNPWGLYDMLGNVWEWCEDRRGPYEAAPVTDPRGLAVGSYRVMRGGSWSSYARYVRAAYRAAYDPANRDGLLGFRLARGQGGPGRGGARGRGAAQPRVAGRGPVANKNRNPR
jgi:formylglycine-generating enzyme required for sulfatase activity